MDAVISYIAITALRMAENVRLESRYNLPPLMADIGLNGLKNPIMVYLDGKEYPVLQGHRRLKAIILLQQTDPKRFAELFPEGIPCIVRKVSGAKDIARLKVDHGNELSLNDPFELYKCAKFLFDAGFGEKEVIIELRGLAERQSPMKAEREREIANLPPQKDKDKAYFEYRRGLIQGLHNIARCPFIVEAALEFKATGEEVKGYENQFLPKLTMSQVSRLWKAFQEDGEVERKDGTKVYSKRNPGPKFLTVWDKIVASAQKAEADKEDGVVREKAMSGKDMKAELTESKWLSRFGQLLTKHHTGDKSVGDLKELDYSAYCIELVQEADPKLWKQVEKQAKAIEAEVNKANAEVAETEAAKA